MEWWLMLIIIFGSLLLLMASGMLTACCFMLIIVVGMFIFWGGETGLEQLVISLRTSITSFAFLPLPLFILMGEVLFQSGIAPYMIDTIDKWIGRLPGRLGVIAVGAGTLFATLTGSSMGSAAMLGSSLVPEMEKRGYKKSMSLGPIMGSGCLASMIPPSGLAVLLAVLAEVSVGKVLIAIIIPGLLMALIYAIYIVVRCYLQPSIALPYNVPPTPLLEKLTATVRYILPVVFIIFLVIGIMFLGVATPTESAATGALGTFILAAAYGRLNWEVVKKSVSASIAMTGMLFMIIAGATAYGQIVAYCGAVDGLVKFATALTVAPILILIAMQVVLLVLGMFMSVTAIMMICTPMFMPPVHALGLDPVWFVVLFLVNMEVAQISPPFGMVLFVMKGVAPPDTTMGDIFRAALPFCYLDLIAMALIIAFPAIALWLPSAMH